MRCSSYPVLTIALLIGSCSNYMLDQSGFFSKFRRGEYEQAASLIEKKANTEGKDQILFLLDRGVALFEARDYKSAIESFSKAEKLSEIKDYTSISEETVSIISSDTYKKFVPLDYERIMINVYLALSYLMIGKNEDALVECRRINNLVYLLKTKGMKAFEDNPLAWYISGLVYESKKDKDNSRIDYEKVIKLMPKFTQASKDLGRVTGRSPGLCNGCGTVLVLLGYGEVPIKRQSSSNQMFPEFFTRTHADGSIVVVVDEKDEYGGSMVFDVEDVARKDLSERIGRITAKRMVGVAAKVAI